MEDTLLFEFIAAPDDFEVLVSDCQITLRGCGVTEEFFGTEDEE